MSLTPETPSLIWHELRRWHTVRCRVAGQPQRVIHTGKPEYANLDAWTEAVLRVTRLRALEDVADASG